MSGGQSAPEVTLGQLGRILSEPARLQVLDELMSGTPLPAGALAARLGIAPSTASAHLRQLTEAGLIDVRTQGRSRLYSLSRADVADAVEAMLRLTAQAPGSGLRAVKRISAMRQARSCYDHLAGVHGVALYVAACERGWVCETGDGGLHLPADGLARCREDLGLPIELPSGRRDPVRPCPDWTERRPHLGGRFGAALLAGMIEAGWLRRRTHDRALTVTPAGDAALASLTPDPAESA